MITTVPFSGFYNSLHDSNLDLALERMFSDRATGCHVNKELYHRAFGSIEWGMVHAKYADEYTQQFAHEYGLTSLKFESLRSPKYYNFETDRIFAEISEEEVRRLLLSMSGEALAKAAKYRFTSCSGFISFYNPDVSTWGPIEEWDHNQVGTVLVALAWDLDELTLMESAECNGKFDDWLYSSSQKVHRLLNVHEYLQAREERAA